MTVVYIGARASTGRVWRSSMRRAVDVFGALGVGTSKGAHNKADGFVTVDCKPDDARVAIGFLRAELAASRSLTFKVME